MGRGTEARAERKLHTIEKFARDESGAALIEYTILLGMLVVAVVTIIGAVGTWVNGRWTTLNTSLK